MSAASAEPAPLSMDLLLASLERLARWVDDGLPRQQRRPLDELRGDPDVISERVRATTPDHTLITLALLDDCLRGVHCALEAERRDGDELDQVFPLVFTAASRYGRTLGRYRDFAAVDGDGATHFLRVHRHDERPLGWACARTAWLGAELCSATARATGGVEILAEYERMALRLVDEVLALNGVSAAEAEARRRFAGEIDARLRASGRDGNGAGDPRALAFCRGDGPDVFGGVVRPAQVHERDPFDVDTIHAPARAAFERLLDHVTTPVRHDRGRILLVRGESGSGKTHLLRALRTLVHGRRAGYAGYAALASDAGDYGRYLLANLVDSLEKPYDLPALDRQGLDYLSDGLAELGEVISPDELERLRTEELEPDALGAFVSGLVDRLLRTGAFADVDADVVQALLLVQRRDPAVAKRVVKLLRCEELTAPERRLLGGLAPRLDPEAPLRMIEQLGRLMWATSQAALVLLVDQVEDVYDAEAGDGRFRRAVGALRAIAERLPSAVVVLACLDDLWARLRDRITQSDRDRLEREPPPVVLHGPRSGDEIEALIARRLENLYAAQGVSFRPDGRLFPFTRAQLERLANQRTRDALHWCRRFHDACVARGALVDDIDDEPRERDGAGEREAARTRAALDQRWNDFRVGTAPAIDDDDEALLGLLAAAAIALAAELPSGAWLRAARDGDYLSIESAAAGQPPMRELIGITNGKASGRALQRQIEELERVRGGRPASAAVAVRTSDFRFGRGTKIVDVVARFLAAGNRKLVIDHDSFRTIAAFRDFVAQPRDAEALAAWRRAAQPLASVPALRELFGLERLLSTPVANSTSIANSTPIASSTFIAHSTSVADAQPAPVVPVANAAGGAMLASPPSSRLRLGVTASLRAEPVEIEAQELTRHAVFLGSTGSGKSTVALNLVEQLAERGIPALLVDRKGDLCGYASARWWDEVPSDPVMARRKAALRQRLDVKLYTPGDTRGRNLFVPLLPAGWEQAHEQEREKIAKYCAAGLAALMGYGQSETHGKRAAVLKAALELHAGRPLTLPELVEAVTRPDQELLVRVSHLGRFFRPVAEDLQTLSINFGHLVAAEGETLDIGRLLGGRDGRTALTIVSTRFLGETSTLSFWVSRLLVELARWFEQHPRPQLQAVALFDEADLYLPATSSAATKEPMMDLLKRARSKGLGVLLASQNPGDFDYKGRENMNTWLVGKVTQERSIDKMRDLLGDYPNIAGLATQARGSFFLLQAPPPRELRADRSILETRELAPDEILALAREQTRAT